jgi:type IV pilus assembly protein PilE
MAAHGGRLDVHRRRFVSGFTWIEVLTAMVVVGVLAAVAIPSWRTHLLRARRGDATAALIEVQKAQDSFFGRHARYASAAELTTPPPGGLGLTAVSGRRFYRIEMATSADGLSYTATASVVGTAGQSDDARCVALSIDHLGQRRAVDGDGNDRTPDCWK